MSQNSESTAAAATHATNALAARLTGSWPSSAPGVMRTTIFSGSLSATARASVLPDAAETKTEGTPGSASAGDLAIGVSAASRSS